MRTLEQIADELGTTKAIIYKRFRDFGLSVSDLKGEKVGKTRLFNDDVFRLCSFMCSEVNNENTNENMNGNTNENIIENTNTEKIKELQRIIDDLKETQTETEQKYEAEKERANKETARVDELIKQISNLTDAIKAAEVIQASQSRLLSDNTKSKGFFAKLFSGRKEKRDSNN